MTFKKITHGFVVQTFEDGKCIDQEFIAGDDCEYETPDGEVLEDSPPVYEYEPFHMVQPKAENRDKGSTASESFFKSL